TAARADTDLRQRARTLEVLVATAKPLPEIDQLRMLTDHAREPRHVVLIQARREDVDRDALLPDRTRLDRDPVQLLDRLVRDRDAALGHTPAVNEDVTAQRASTTDDTVRSVRVVHVNREMVLASRVQEVDPVEP